MLVGTRTGSADGYGQQAFFFVDGRYIGTDAKQPSATVNVVCQGDTEVTLAYPLYRKSDALCCPGGGTATCHFQLNNGKLVPLEAIPPASSASGLSRSSAPTCRSPRSSRAGSARRIERSAGMHDRQACGRSGCGRSASIRAAGTARRARARLRKRSRGHPVRDGETRHTRGAGLR